MTSPTPLLYDRVNRIELIFFLVQSILTHDCPSCILLSRYTISRSKAMSRTQNTFLESSPARPSHARARSLPATKSSAHADSDTDRLVSRRVPSLSWRLRH